MSSDKMRSYHVLALLAVLAGNAYGSSTPPTDITRNVGEYFEAAVPTFLQVVEQCYISTPSMKNVNFIPTDESDDKYEVMESSDMVGCRVRVQNLDENDTGIWTLHTVTVRGVTSSQSYNVTVNSPAVPEPDNPEKEREINVINLDELRFDTKLGATHRIEIPFHDFVNTESCYMITPEEVRVNLESENIPGIEIIKDSNVACGVIVNLEEEAQVGQWFLISKEIRWGSELYERRLPFSIYVTEEVNAIPNEISVVQDKDFYVRLENTVTNPETCKLLRPDRSEYAHFETDSRYVDTCGFIVRNVDKKDNGSWQIVYGNRITYSAHFQVTILTDGKQDHAQQQLYIWTRDKPVQEIVGSVDAVYCKVTDPKGFIAFEGFGRCNITLPRANSDHEGEWKMYVGIRGRVLTEESIFTVQVMDGSPKPVVNTEITSNKPVVTLTCSVSTSYPIHACKFRDPSGHILIANPGVGEDRFTYHGKESSFKSGVYTHNCGIQITNPLVRDLGFWRCAIETSEETYYGFLSVWCPFMSQDPEVVASVLREPTLTAERSSLEVIEGDNVLMSCSVQSAIRYCYFRTSNGTVYNVGPGFSSTDMAEYAGAGLDAGECSIRFRSLNERSGGRWSCHVGFHELHMPEQRANFNVNVNEIMTVTQNNNAIRVVVEGRRQLDYCRFVRIDGFGFTSDSVPASYFVKAFLHIGECTLWIFDGSILDMHPWTVVARVTGHTQEITRTTNGNMRPPSSGIIVSNRLQSLWLVFLFSGIILIVLGALLAPKKNRNWTYAKAASIRNSFRHRFAKKVVAEENISEKNTANAA